MKNLESKFKGVVAGFFDGYAAIVMFEGDEVFLGEYEKERDAASAVIKAERLIKLDIFQR